MATEAESSQTLTLIEMSPDSAEEREKKAGGANKNRRYSGVEMWMADEKELNENRRYSGVEMWTADEKESNDNECCILPSDPSEEIDLRISEPDQAADQDDDNVAVLAVRGKVACRDYPHARHSCGEYPFNETSHEDCCSQCYCYVCDVPAPCSHWKGSDGHCHAFSGDTKWDLKRLTSRLNKKWH
ncbi:hypothetical protein LUZ63_010206 [Rhynchospora breviuscula]|uniref:TNFR-Cys domain-containing protein n=1 Tax=Rhynchospora breviuscula TaxID=2022672 RepID=A0A9Q0HPQ9_9POAL|nr:hypothetical protein LUZ63_010206 [Rhynchospora breviuscula]